MSRPNLPHRYRYRAGARYRFTGITAKASAAAFRSRLFCHRDALFTSDGKSTTTRTRTIRMISASLPWLPSIQKLFVAFCRVWPHGTVCFNPAFPAPTPVWPFRSAQRENRALRYSPPRSTGPAFARIATHRRERTLAGARPKANPSPLEGG
jgi:hypothetical protein